MVKAESATLIAVLQTALQEAPDSATYASLVVNEPFRQAALAMAELFLGFICLYVVDGEDLRLVAASDTEYYHLAVSSYPAFDPANFSLPLSQTDNDIVRAVLTNKPVHTDDWSSVKRPAAAAETVRLNQASSGIAMAYSYPLSGPKPGVLMYNFYQYAEAIGSAQLQFMEQYTELVSASLV